MGLDMVFFELRGRRCALPASIVREVVVVPNVTPVPLAPPLVRGITPLRGQVLPVLDLGVWLAPGADPHARTGDKALLIDAALDQDTPLRVVLAVDCVLRLGTIDESHSRPPPPGPAFISGTVFDVDGPALLIDADRAIERTRDAIRATVQK